jgi:hypothetical protein
MRPPVAEESLTWQDAWGVFCLFFHVIYHGRELGNKRAMFQDVSREHLQGKDAEATISFAGFFDSADVQSKETGSGPLGNTTLSGPII